MNDVFGYNVSAAQKTAVVQAIARNPGGREEKMAKEGRRNRERRGRGEEEREVDSEGGRKVRRELIDREKRVLLSISHSSSFSTFLRWNAVRSE